MGRVEHCGICCVCDVRDWSIQARAGGGPDVSGSRWIRFDSNTTRNNRRWPIATAMEKLV